MIINGIIFDVNGTLTDIQTDEGLDDVYRVVSNLLSYQGISLDLHVIKNIYFQIMNAQRASQGERHPEFDAIGIFRDILNQHATEFTHQLPSEKIEQLPRFLAETYRATSRLHLQPYSGVNETILQLHQKYHLAIVSDGQSAYTVPELHAVGLSSYFDPIIVSGDFGYRKPDERLFLAALSHMKMEPSEVIFVGNDLYRDIYGAQKLGMKTVFFKSNQGIQEKKERHGMEPDYIIYNFPELFNAIHFFEHPVLQLSSVPGQ